MRDIVELRNFSKAAQGPLVLCTLIRKSGSSYRDIGAKKIVSVSSGQSCGFLSGGCLEASIEKMAVERQGVFVESFSTLSDEDRLMGYQTGCQGVIEILFQPMTDVDLDLLLPFGAHPKAPGVVVDIAGPQLGHREFSAQKPNQNQIFEAWIQPVHLVLIGCGPDVDSYLPLAKSLGWSLQFLDDRRDIDFPKRHPSESFQRVPAMEMGSKIPEGPMTAVILMTHNYEVDLEIMRGLKDLKVGYLGCLGPAVRYERLKRDLQELYGESVSAPVDEVVSAPAGIFSHGRSPGEIALSVIAQIQEKLVQYSQSKVWTLILAAGAASRFGSAKALAVLNGKTLLEQALAKARSTSGERVMVVTGGHAEAILPHLSGALATYNEKWREGMGTSIAAGVRGILQNEEKIDGIIILPVDQPLVTEPHLEALKTQALKSNRCVLTSNADGVIGAPAAIPRSFFEKAQSLHGDRGLKSVLLPAEYTCIESSRALLDIDVPADLQQPKMLSL